MIYLPKNARGKQLNINCIPRPLNDLGFDNDCDSGKGNSLPLTPMSPQDFQPPGSINKTEVTFCVTNHLNYTPKYYPDLAASLCGGLMDSSITPEKFESKLLTYTQLLEKLSSGDLSLIRDPNLVIRVQEKYLSWESA